MVNFQRQLLKIRHRQVGSIVTNIFFLFLVLMREPVIEDNASDHALFCKYAGELLERVTGKALATSTVVPSLSRITKVISR